MSFEITHFFTALISYLFGSISSAIIVSKILNIADPRTYGSGNPGATNVLRSGSKKAAILTLIFDILKGYLAVFICKEIFTNNSEVAAIACFFAVVGHIYPFWLRFKGGKGVATALGVLLAYAPLLALLVILIFVIVILLFRFVSLASIISALGLVILIILAARLPLLNLQPSLVEILLITAMAVLIIFRHHPNIKRLFHKNEPKIFRNS